MTETLQRMRWRRQYFNRDAYAAGKHCGSTTCSVEGCDGLAISEVCETLQCEPGSLDMWFPLCNDHATKPVPTWSEAMEPVVNRMIWGTDLPEQQCG